MTVLCAFSDQFQDLKKQKKASEAEKIREIQQLQVRNNALQTDYENSKITTASATKKMQEAVNETERVEAEITQMNSVLEQRNEQYDQTVSEIKERDARLLELQGEIISKHQEM